MPRIENFGRTWAFTPAQFASPTSREELVDVVRSASKVRVMGARHSWSRGIVTDDTLITLDRLNAVLDVDREAMQVTVQAGVRLKDLIVELEGRGLALDNLGSVVEQSMAGAISTGTHGTGIGHRCLADLVQALTLIDANGEVRELDRSHPDFPAVVVGLGGFGVIDTVTVSVVPTFQMHAITESMPFGDLIANLDSLVRSHDHFKVWWFVPNDDVIVYRQDHTDAERNDSDFQRWFKDEFLAVLTYRPMIALQRLWRDPLVAWTNRLLGGAYAKRFERICKSHAAFLTPDPPVHRETEWAFDYADAAELLREYRGFMLGSGYSYNFVQEIRFTGRDDFWLSPSQGRDSIWLSMYNIDGDERWLAQRAQFEEFARAHGGRPHWGKEADFEAARLADHYPRLSDFSALRAAYDPDGKFENDWVRRVLRG